MGEDLRTFLGWLQSRPVPLGHFTPMAASVLFAAAHYMPWPVLRFVAYAAASVLAILLVIDIASDMLESDNDGSSSRISRQEVPVTVFQFVLTGFQAGMYTFLIFLGLGPFTPIIFVVPVFAFACIAAWRNVRLWYRQGADFEERLHEAQVEDAEMQRRRSLQRPSDPHLSGHT